MVYVLGSQQYRILHADALDPFSGSFTTGFVSKKLNRCFVGIELQEEYVKIGLRRLGLATAYDGIPLKTAEKSYKIPQRTNIQQMKLFV